MSKNKEIKNVNETENMAEEAVVKESKLKMKLSEAKESVKELKDNKVVKTVGKFVGAGALFVAGCVLGSKKAKHSDDYYIDGGDVEYSDAVVETTEE